MYWQIVSNNKMYSKNVKMLILAGWSKGAGGGGDRDGECNTKKIKKHSDMKAKIVLNKEIRSLCSF